MRLTSGTRLGPYEIVAPLGAGGMGEVYRARDPRLGREVAVKVLPADVADHPDRLARFDREARAIAALSHPNIVVLHSIEEAAGIRFLTMELVEGETLDRHIPPEGLAPGRVVELGLALADALAAAHAKGVIHRDLKPQNVVMSREGRLKVLDFGLARLSGSELLPEMSQALTASLPNADATGVVGTAFYMSPEQIRGLGVDARSDLFALGVVLYELLTGRRPFQGATFLDVTASILRDAPVPVSSLRADLPAGLGRVIARCLEKTPDQRFQNANDVREALAQVRRAGGSTAPDDRGASIAVMPFENRGHDQEDEYFADGITEDVIAQLCKVRTLRVISRNSVMAFKGHTESLQEIAARLEVANVLEGSVRRVGDRVRIVARLVEPLSGRNLWAETYDRKLTDIFEIQAEVALQIAGALQAELTPSERARIQRDPVRDVLAYELYLRGRQSMLRFTQEELARSIHYFEQAIERDPGFAPAHVGLALAHTEFAEQGGTSREEGGALARAAADRAVALDPEDGDAHCAQAYVRMVFDLDWAGAEAGFRRAIERSPGSAFAYDFFGRMCAGLGRFDEAIALQEKAHSLDPLTQRIDIANSLLRAGRNQDAERAAARAVRLEPRDARIRATHGWALFRMGNLHEGIAELEMAAALAPAEDMWQAQLGQALGFAGRGEEARVILDRLEDPGRSKPVSPYHLAYLHTGLGDADRAMDCLERAFEQGTGPVYGIKGSFLFEPLRSHPRFAALMRRMGAS